MKKRLLPFLPLMLLVLGIVITEKTQAANWITSSFLDKKVAAVAFQYGTTNAPLTQQSVTNGLGPMGTNGLFWYQWAYTFPSIVEGSGFTVVGTPNYGGPIGGGVYPYLTNSYTQPYFVNPYLAVPVGSNALFLQWLAGNTNANGSSVGLPFLLTGVAVGANANGDINSNATLTIASTTDAATGTNINTFVFARIPNLINIDSNYTWVVTTTNNGTNQVVMVTNPPSYMVQGTKGIVCTSIGIATNGTSAGKYLGTNFYLQVLDWTQPRP